MFFKKISKAGIYLRQLCKIGIVLKNNLQVLLCKPLVNSLSTLGFNIFQDRIDKVQPGRKRLRFRF